MCTISYLCINVHLLIHEEGLVALVCRNQDMQPPVTVYCTQCTLVGWLMPTGSTHFVCLAHEV